MKWILQYTGLLRQVRLLHWFNNLANFRSLRKNRPIYRALGMNRSIFRSLDSRILSRYIDINDPPSFLPPATAAPLSPQISDYLKGWNKDGFILLKAHFSNSKVDEINQAIQAGLLEKKLHFNYTGRKIINAHEVVEVVRQVCQDPEILALLEAVFQRPAELFQTISFTKGSEQKPHSDSMHMTTIPLGNLAGVWVALEDINEKNGPLIYYPASHKLPYIFNSDYGNSSTLFMLDGAANSKYEKKVAEHLKLSGLPESILHARKGDVLIWHANLIHGGAPIQDPGSSRKSMVAHYFARDVLCFHEISERPAIRP